MSDHTPSRRTVVRTAAWTLPAVSVGAAAPAFASASKPEPNLSTSVAKASNRNGKKVKVEPATLINSGEVTAQGLVVNIVTGVPVTKVTVTVLVEQSVTAFGIGISPALPSSNFTLTVPSSGGLGAVSIAAGGSYTAPLAQTFHFETDVPTTMKTVTTAANGGIPFTPAQLTV